MVAIIKILQAKKNINKYITIVNRDIALGVSFFNGHLSINDVLNIVNTL